MNDIYDMLAQSDPETLQAMIDAGLAPQRAGIAKQRLALGEGFLNTPSAQGRNVGQTYVASSPLEHLSVLAQHLLGAKLAGGAMQQQQGLATQTGAGRLAYLRMLAGQNSPPPMPQPQAQDFTPMDYSKT